MTRPQILVAHPWVANGGSEATTMWVLRALQDDFDVTLVTAGEIDFDILNETFDCGIKQNKIRVIKAPVIPGVKNGMKLVAWQHALFHRFCRKIATDFDLCISGYNFVPFGKPSIQLIGDFSFNEELRNRYYIHSHQSANHRPSLVRSAYLQIRKLIAGGEHKPDIEDLVLANSTWTAGVLNEHLNLNCDVLFPPVQIPKESVNNKKRNEFGFLYIGRISPEKEIEKIIAILDEVHGVGYPVSFDLAGNNQQTPYEKMIFEMSQERVWINDLGYLSGEKKEAAFSANSFGIQACQCEAFGIAAAEMASRGCIPFVAAGCGPAEVVPFRELQFESIEDAAKKIVHLLETPPLTEYFRKKVVAGTKRFSASEFVVNLREIVDSLLQTNESLHLSANVTNNQGRSTRHRSGVLSEKNP